jgi:hypothetical protein
VNRVIESLEYLAFYFIAIPVIVGLGWGVLWIFVRLLDLVVGLHVVRVRLVHYLCEPPVRMILAALQRHPEALADVRDVLRYHDWPDEPIEEDETP